MSTFRITYQTLAAPTEDIHRAFDEAVERVRAGLGETHPVWIDGRPVRAGETFAHGYFVTPTLVDRLPPEHRLLRDELFVPLLALAEVESLDEAIELSNRAEYGLTAGIFSEDRGEIEAFFDRIEAGVVYANRRSGATTGAWPGVNPFCGWKASGSTGKGVCGPYYVQQFMREQSRTVME